jgi:hypothetical protein
MFNKYFEEWEVRPEFEKEFVSLWAGWLGKENYHKLGEVSEKEWGYFNNFIRLIAQEFEMVLVDCHSESLTKIDSIDSTLSTYSESMNKDSKQFSKYVIAPLDCVVTEEWDYTYIIWHKNNGAVERLIPYIKRARLEHFHE